MFILNHTRLLSPRFLHFILLNFITSSSILLHLRFAFLLVCNFCVFYQYQCGSAFSQVESQISQYDFFFSCTGTFVHFFSFHLDNFWFTKCKFVLVFRTIYIYIYIYTHILSTNFMPAESWILAGIYRNTPKHLK